MLVHPVKVCILNMYDEVWTCAHRALCCTTGGNTGATVGGAVGGAVVVVIIAVCVIIAIVVFIKWKKSRPKQHYQAKYGKT